MGSFEIGVAAGLMKIAAAKIPNRLRVNNVGLLVPKGPKWKMTKAAKPPEPVKPIKPQIDWKKAGES